LLDCHSFWAAACFLKQRDELQQPPCTVTAEFHVKMRAPTPSDRPLGLIARPVWSERSKVRVEASIRAGDEVTATCMGLFIAVKPGHPAYHRW
jgi:acyl-coenzyme A thioesterase PaaI-like protein